MKKIIHVKGMYCVSCEYLIEKELKKIPNIFKVKANHKKGLLEIEASDISMKKIKRVVEKRGYKIVEEGEKKVFLPKFTKKDFFQISSLLILGLFFIWIFSYFEIYRFFPNVDENIGIAVALLLGIIASVSTCLALIGGIVMSFSSQYSLKTDSFYARALPQIYFHIGRVASFFILGGLLGVLGRSLEYSFSFAGYLTIFVALIMFYIALQILGFVPSITRLGFYLPKSLSKKIYNIQEKKHPFVPTVIGALSFFLPCGFTQSMQLIAVASGSFWTGGLIMMVFALGTLPVLFSVGIGSSYTQKKKFGFFKKAVAVVILFFSLYSLNSGLSLAGSSFNFDFWKNNTAIYSSDEQINNEDIQTVTMNIDYRFEPSQFRIKKDIPVRFIINANHITGCSDEVIIPRFNLSTGKLKNGDTAILEFTPKRKGTIPFSCWMGMIRGSFIVE